MAQEDINVAEESMNLAIGIDEIRKFDYKLDSRPPTIGDDSKVFVSVSRAKQQITFRGIRTGKTSVTVRDQNGDIRDRFLVNVTADGNSQTVKELRELIGDVEGIEINIRGGKVIVEGEIVVPADLAKINIVLSQYPDVLVLIEYSRQTQLIIAREMQDAIQKSAMKDVTVRVVNGDYWLEGVVNSVDKQKLAQEIADAYKVDFLQSLASAQGGARVQARQRGNILNFINVNQKKDPEPPAKLVKITTQFVELSKNYAKNFSFKWQPFLSTNASISFGRDSDGGLTTEESNNGTLAGTISGLFPKLNAAKSAGYARVIQSGMVVTNENRPVSIQKTTSQDFAVGSGENTVAKSASVTFTVNTTPEIGTEENVTLKNLSVDVTLPGQTAANGTPQNTTNKIQTNITVKSKESAVIGGVIQSASLTAYDKDPNPTVASNDPNDPASATQTLFNLYRGKDYSTNKNQFVIFVTPEILESASKGTAEIRRKFRRRER
ncbi:MAG: hypothetical protein CME62_02370 [Halobacteriovoraceae bacterium]|nr:hypothetical protein [Halobacteriovoraceae bacterium]|tara:strand:- start:22234 stop:23712 length:1479 start_codon:yes stop_codon:yes gene_type:complete